MARSIKAGNPIEYMMHQARQETEIAESIIEKIRNKKSTSTGNEYYEEKLALKMLDFFKEEEKVITLYAEAKQNYPLLAELMENKRPYLKELLEESRKLYEKSLLEKN